MTALENSEYIFGYLVSVKTSRIVREYQKLGFSRIADAKEIAKRKDYLLKIYIYIYIFKNFDVLIFSYICCANPLLVSFMQHAECAKHTPNDRQTHTPTGARTQNGTK